MKKLVLSLVISVMLAGAAQAYVQVGHLTPADVDPQSGTTDVDVVRGDVVETTEQGDEGTAPVPEPGTIALASMGLMALGAAHRRRKGK